MAITLGADDKKKIYILGGVAGLLGLVGVVFILRPFGSAAIDNSVVSNAVSNTVANRAISRVDTAAPGLPPNPGSLAFTTVATTKTVDASTTVAGNLTPQIPGAAGIRTDPFVPLVLPALPPSPTPAPTRQTVYDNVPVSLPSFSPPSAGTGANLPANSFAPGAQPTLASTTLYLPPATIFGGTQRTEPAPLPQVGGLTVGEPGAQTMANSASGKRVAGVILGDSIRALIEYQENGQTVSKVVQPGDEVGGMKILSIQRLKVGEQSVVRVTARENGRDEYFDLGPGS